ncbi:hypothetical protein [Sphingomonas sp. KC8]|uniref:hypothetical protein n=1 Tax=Sphingomonas sp. KC8 TaxID=1030157 RepID=UPI00024886A7|nr:hypothetical protein [Sphingomonas sp. KC8]ARS27127.1 ioquinoline 1-oxidoreductase subunit [Sphingomonas sp. KC8]
MIRAAILATAAALSVAAVGGAMATAAPQPAPQPAPAAKLRPALATSLKPVSAFAGIADKRARSLALFGEVGKVLQHPRCLNCHPATERPTQTERMTPHMPMVVRGDGGIGATGLRCTTCHGPANYAVSGVPGHPQWHLAPPEMAWAGKTLGQICRQLKDPERNGGKSMADMIEHMTNDTLVGWGWAPGGKRVPAPGTQAEFGALYKAWADSGAVCPA